MSLASTKISRSQDLLIFPTAVWPFIPLPVRFRSSDNRVIRVLSNIKIYGWNSDYLENYWRSLCLQQGLQTYHPLWLLQPDSQPDSSVERSYFPLNLKNERTGLRILVKNLILVFFFSVGCYLKLNTSNHFSLQCRCFPKPTSILYLNQVEERTSNLLSRVLRWHQVQCRATHLPSNTEHHIHYRNISLSYRPRVILLFPMKICADLQWVETSVPKSLVSSCFSQGRGLDLFSSAKVSTSEKKYAQPVLAPLCQEAEMEGERLPCHSHLPGWSLQSSACLLAEKCKSLQYIWVMNRGVCHFCAKLN